MNPRTLTLIIAGAVVALGAIIASTLLFVPENTHPAYEAALTFANAAGQGDDETAMPILSDALQAYVAENCPDGSVSACVMAYTPPEWGGLIRAVFRRATPDGTDAWDVDVIATYEEGTGFSGVCMYYRVEVEADGVWRIQRWAGYEHCGDPATRNMATNPDAPNRAP